MHASDELSPGGPAAADAVFSIVEGADGVWSVNERGFGAAAVSYFPSKWTAMRHAVRLARERRSCLVRVLRTDGEVTASHSYAQGSKDERPPRH